MIFLISFVAVFSIGAYFHLSNVLDGMKIRQEQTYILAEALLKIEMRRAEHQIELDQQRKAA